MVVVAVVVILVVMKRRSNGVTPSAPGSKVQLVTFSSFPTPLLTSFPRTSASPLLILMVAVLWFAVAFCFRVLIGQLWHFQTPCMLICCKAKVGQSKEYQMG